VPVVRGERQRRLHKAFLRYHDPENWPLLRDALRDMGRADLIGNGKHQLIPTHQPRPGAAKKTSGSATTRRRGPGRQPREGHREGTEAGRKNRSRPAGSSAQRRKTRQSS